MKKLNVLVGRTAIQSKVELNGELFPVNEFRIVVDVKDKEPYLFMKIPLDYVNLIQGNPGEKDEEDIVPSPSSTDYISKG